MEGGGRWAVGVMSVEGAAQNLPWWGSGDGRKVHPSRPRSLFPPFLLHSVDDLVMEGSNGNDDSNNNNNNSNNDNDNERWTHNDYQMTD